MEEKELIERLVSVEQESKSNAKQIEFAKQEIARVEAKTNDIHRIATSVEIMATKMEVQNTKIDEIGKEVKSVKDDVTDLKIQPAKKWDKVTWLVLSGVITFVLGYMLNTIIK